MDLLKILDIDYADEIVRVLKRIALFVLQHPLYVFFMLLYSPFWYHVTSNEIITDSDGFSMPVHTATILLGVACYVIISFIHWEVYHNERNADVYRNPKLSKLYRILS